MIQPRLSLNTWIYVRQVSFKIQFRKRTLSYLLSIIMEYRILSRLLAAFYLIVSIFMLMIATCQAFAFLFHVVTSSFNTYLIGLALLLFSWYSSVANIKLLNATKKQLDFQQALQLCKCWWIWAWITLCAGGLFLLWSLIVITVNFDSDNFKMSEMFKDPDYWKYLAQVAAFILHVYAITCVYSYMEDLTFTLPRTTSDSMTHLVEQAENEHEEVNRNSEPPPTYSDTVKSSEIYVPPPAYDSIAHTNI